MGFFFGRVSERELLAAAGTDKAKLTAAHTYIGYIAGFSLLKATDPTIARRHFQWVKVNGIATVPEYKLALAALKDLASR
jgi:hypothetical protein